MPKLIGREKKKFRGVKLDADLDRAIMATAQARGTTYTRVISDAARDYLGEGVDIVPTNIVGSGSGFLVGQPHTPAAGVVFQVHIEGGVGSFLLNFDSDGTPEGTQQFNAAKVTATGGTDASPTWDTQGFYRPNMAAPGVPATSVSGYLNKTLTTTVTGTDGTIYFEGAAEMLTGNVVAS